MTNQPMWKCVGQLGDASPLDYGGYWVFVDTTGVYQPEGEWVDVEDGTNRLTIYRFVLEKCTFIKGVLSDNPYHPEHPAWFADDLESCAASSGTPIRKLRRMLCSDDPIQRALGYREIGLHWGFRNLDDYPLEMGRTEGRRRYKKAKYRTPK